MLLFIALQTQCTKAPSILVQLVCQTPPTPHKKQQQKDIFLLLLSSHALTQAVMTHHQPAHGEENTEEGFQRPQTVHCTTLALQSSHTSIHCLTPWSSE